MKLVTAAEMRAIEARIAGECQVPLLLLMENAGRAVADAAQAMLGNGGGAVVVCAGRGNNGGDGFVAARHLLCRGVAVSVLLFAEPQAITGDAATNLAAAQGAGVDVVPAGDDAAERLAQAALIIDALLGTGASGAPRGAIARAVALINAAARPVLAVDLPTGVEADTGQTPGEAVAATASITFALPKWGHYLYPGAALCGRVSVIGIGVPPRAIDTAALRAEVLAAATVAAWLPRLPGDAHKGTRGRVLVIGGSLGMAGAPVLAGRGALRSGCGTVRLLVPAAVQAQAAAMQPELMVQSAADTADGAFAGAAAAAAIAQQAAGADVLILGPGFSRAPQAVACTRALLPQLAQPTVLDADGLMAFAGDAQSLRSAGAPLVITPHPGELAALLGTTTATIQADRPGALRAAVAATGATVVLKGAHSLVGAPDGRCYVNPTGNRGMGTAGAGDVLTGVIATCLAQGLPAPEAAAAGVYLHGLAGDLAAEQLGPDGLLAGDLVEALPLARLKLLKG